MNARSRTNSARPATTCPSVTWALGRRAYRSFAHRTSGPPETAGSSTSSLDPPTTCGLPDPRTRGAFPAPPMAALGVVRRGRRTAPNRAVVLSAAASCAKRTIWRSAPITSRRPKRLPQPWHRHSRHDDAAVVQAIVPGHGLTRCDPTVGFPARSSGPMPYGSSSAAGDVGVARTGSRITRAMQPSAARGETSGPRLYEGRPLVKPCVRLLTPQVSNCRVSDVVSSA
jgi:hypothetical protein